MASGGRVAGAIRSLVNARDLQLECGRVFLVPVLMCGSTRILWKEKERSRVRAIQTDNIRQLLGINRIDKVPNARVRELCRVKKAVNERIDKDVLRWFGHVERMERDRISKRVYVG